MIQVTALDTGISVNMFYGDASENGYLDKILKPPYFDHFRYWFLNVIEQNRKFESFRYAHLHAPNIFFQRCFFFVLYNSNTVNIEFCDYGYSG